MTGCGNLQNALSTGPVSVAVDGTNWSPYKTGIFNNCATNLNHAVLLVGCNSSGVWKIKNSWGTSWGQLGYM
jgi:C1A family cysteine protease